MIDTDYRIYQAERTLCSAQQQQVDTDNADLPKAVERHDRVLGGRARLMGRYRILLAGTAVFTAAWG